MEKFNRAVRRHHITRLKKNRKNYWGYGRAYMRAEMEMSPKQLGGVVQHPQICSCSGCGNRRQYEGSKLKELCDWIVLKEFYDFP